MSTSDYPLRRAKTLLRNLNCLVTVRCTSMMDPSTDTSDLPSAQRRGRDCHEPRRPQDGGAAENPENNLLANWPPAGHGRIPAGEIKIEGERSKVLARTTWTHPVSIVVTVMLAIIPRARRSGRAASRNRPSASWD
jgi:hypothetical protein